MRPICHLGLLSKSGPLADGSWADFGPSAGVIFIYVFFYLNPSKPISLLSTDGLAPVSK
jgi:hypothetical protein